MQEFRQEAAPVSRDTPKPAHPPSLQAIGDRRQVFGGGKPGKRGGWSTRNAWFLVNLNDSPHDLCVRPGFVVGSTLVKIHLGDSSGS